MEIYDTAQFAKHKICFYLLPFSPRIDLTLRKIHFILSFIHTNVVTFIKALLTESFPFVP